ncbi:MAG: GNAT family N-acetyltransferase [Propionibacteriaceae bacterium]|nr:GNAT family N-acetyltransferase [Propionibacteriaceae bacterium]
MKQQSIRIVQLEQPISYPGDNQWLQDGAREVYVAHNLELYGNTDLVSDASDIPLSFNDQHEKLHRWWCAVVGEGVEAQSVVGVAKCDLDIQDSKLAEVAVIVHPQWRRRGIGTTLLHFVENHPDLAGRSVLINWDGDFSAADDAGEQVLAPTGQGSAPASAPGMQFALKYGYTFEQVERLSACPLPVVPDALEQFIRESRAKATGYRALTWDDEIPEAYIDGYALLMTKIYTDAPKGDLQFQEDVWDADRVRRNQEKVKAQGWHRLVSVAVHEATDELAALTILAWKPARPNFGYQEETVVLAAHRGHRLGMLIKALNLQALAKANPNCERLYTWNAEENDYMLSINVALGYRPQGGNCVFQKLR